MTPRTTTTTQSYRPTGNISCEGFGLGCTILQALTEIEIVWTIFHLEVVHRETDVRIVIQVIKAPDTILQQQTSQGVRPVNINKKKN